MAGRAPARPYEPSSLAQRASGSPSSSTTRSVSRDIGVNVAANGVFSVLALLTGTLAARLLGPSGRGQFAAIQTWAAFIGTLGYLGMPEALVFYSASEPDKARNYTVWAVMPALIGCAMLLGPMYFLMPVLLASQTAKTIATAQWYLLIGFAQVFLSVPLCALRGRQDFGAMNVFRLLPISLWMAALCAAWAAGSDSPAYLAGLHLALAVASVPLMIWLVSRRLPRLVQGFKNPIRRLLRFGIPSAVSVVPQNLNLRLDQMLMAGLLPSRSLGLYVIAVAWSAIMAPLFSAIGMVLFPRVASQVLPEERGRALVKIVRLAAPMAIVLASVVAAFAPGLLPLIFGHGFAQAVPAAVVLTFAGGILGIAQLLEDGLRGLGRPVAVMWSEIAGLAVTAVSLLMLLGRFGIMGAAVSSLAGYSTVLYILVMYTHRVTGYSASELLVPSLNEIYRGWIEFRSLVWG